MNRFESPVTEKEDPMPIPAEILAVPRPEDTIVVCDGKTQITLQSAKEVAVSAPTVSQNP